MSQRLMALAALAWSCRPRTPCLRGGRCDFNIAPGLFAQPETMRARRKIGDEWMSRTKVCMNLQLILNSCSLNGLLAVESERFFRREWY